MVYYWYDAIAPTSLGTGVALTQLNGGVDYPISQKANVLLEITPSVISTGALTAAESLMIRSLAVSPSIPTITPKEFVASYAMGGLGTFSVANHPPLRAYKYNTITNFANVGITLQGQAQIANTVAPEMTLTMRFTDGGPDGVEQYYLAPANETNTGTAAGQVAGNDITLNGFRQINMMGGVLTPGVNTASESFGVRGELTSTNFGPVPSPQRFSLQSLAMALGAAVSSIDVGDKWYPSTIPIGASTIVNTGIQLDEAQTATGNFILQVGILR